MKLLVTGGAGFIGSHFVDAALARGHSVITLDALTYAGSLDNLVDALAHSQHQFRHGNIRHVHTVASAMQDSDTVVHFAAESHVDNAITDATTFIQTNVVGTHVLLEAAWQAHIRRFLYVSTDEVYGTLGPNETPWTETRTLYPNNSYAASKAAGELLSRAAHRTHGLPVCITRGCNTYGPRQHAEKFIPTVIHATLADQPVPLYGDGGQIREWLHVSDHVRALWTVLEQGIADARPYNIASGECNTNWTTAAQIVDLLGKPETLLTHVPDRLGHDRRYAMQAIELKRLGWFPHIPWKNGLADTVAWYRQHAQAQVA